MSNEDAKVELVKSLLKKIHEGADPEQLSREFRETLSRVSPFEIVLIEQRLVREGVSIAEIAKLCDLHVRLFREHLASRTLKGVPEGHPLDLLMRENELILRWAELLSLYANAVLGSSGEELGKHLGELSRIVGELRGLRKHYVKLQMLVFPYLERRGIVAVPRVMWAREDQIIVKLRELRRILENAAEGRNAAEEVASKALELSEEISELVFRESRILFPAVWVLLTEGEWAAVKEMAEEIGYLVPVTAEWTPKAKPVMPYEIVPEVREEQVRALPPEFREMALRGLEPDAYEIRRPGDIELSTGFLSAEEVDAIFKSLPLEITYADADDRIRFFSKSRFAKGFVRVKTILGRRLLFCHAPRLESMVKVNVERLKKGEADFREFWTRIGDRIVRVIVAAVRSDDGRYLGTLEVVEDFTEILRNPEEVMKKVMVL